MGLGGDGWMNLARLLCSLCLAFVIDPFAMCARSTLPILRLQSLVLHTLGVST